MASRTEIANLALGHLGQSRIVDLSQNSPAAEALRDCWAPAREATLRAHHWNFATARTTLAPLAEAPAFEWSYQYPLPADYCRLVSVNEVLAGTRDCPFVVEGGRLLSHEANARVVYVRNVEATELWDADFVLAFSFQLAELAAPRLSNDGGQAARIALRKQEAGLTAMLSDATETRPLVRRASEGSEYLAARAGWHREIG